MNRSHVSAPAHGPARRASLVAQRAWLCAAAVGVLVGCGGDLAVDLHEPLLVAETYPASGASVPVEALGQLRVVFTQDLGGRAGADAAVREHFVLASSADGASWEDVNFDDYAYQQEEQTYVLTPARALLDELEPSSELRLTVTAGLTSASGGLLARDRVLFFRVTR